MILVTGGAGYIGSHIIKLLNQEEYETVVVDNLVQGHRELVKWGHFEEVDLGDKEKLAAVFKKYPIEAVIHFAALASVGESVVNPDKYYRNNMANTLNLLEVMKEYGVKKIVFSSTAATFGNPVKDLIDETHPQNPINPYGRTKLMMEKMMADFDRAYGMKYVALRYFNAAGCDPESEIGEWHVPEGHLIPIVMEVAMGKREKMTINGNDFPTPDGTCVRDYVHVTDLASAHLLALKKLMDGGGSDNFNLGNGSGFSNKQVVEMVKKVTGKEFEVVYGPRREGDPAILVADSRKAKEVLGWKPKYADLETIVRTAWEWRNKLG